jgi:hypothetical protein
MGDVVLEGGATMLVAKALEEDLDVMCRKYLESRQALIEPDLVEKP